MTPPVTPAMLKDLERKAKDAAPGPWHYCEDEGIPTVAPGKDCSSAESFIATPEDCNRWHVDMPANGRFIAAASPDVVAGMARELTRMRAVVEAARGIVDLLPSPPLGEPGHAACKRIRATLAELLAGA